MILDPGSQIKDPGSKELSSRIPERGSVIQHTLFQHPGSRIRHPESWSLAPESRIQDLGSWIQDPGSRTQDLGSCIGCWMQDPGPKILDPESWITDPGFQDTRSHILDP